MSQLCFDHLLRLSLAFHTRRKTGEVLRILDRGAAINRIFELTLFNLFPIVADIGVALAVFVVRFEWTLGVVIGLDMAAYSECIVDTGVGIVADKMCSGC
jgi:ABC-type transport system involved in Fe-S cluster assembly fused permease/ATPase subunit